MIINLSNHPSNKWPRKQKLEAKKQYGKIIDMPFPHIEPKMEIAEIAELAKKYAQACIKEFNKYSSAAFPNVVHIMGEMTFTYQFVRLMSEKNILCVASTTIRDVVENERGEKISKFEFAGFRPYKTIFNNKVREYQHHKKHIQKGLIFLPIFILIVSSLIKFYFPEFQVLLFFISAGVCLIIGLILFVIAKYKYPGKGGSLAATTASLLSMQKIPALSLIVISVLAFSWLIDYIRDFFDADPVPLLSVAGSLFSFFLLYLVACIVNYLEKQKLQQLKMYDTLSPVKTTGLILTLSTIKGSCKFKQFEKLLDQLKISREEFQKLFKELQILKSTKKLGKLPTMLKNEPEEKSLTPFFTFLADSPFYPMLAAIFYHKAQLHYLWILASKDAIKSSWDVFEKLFHKFILIDDNIKLVQQKIENTENIHDISFTINKIYEEATENLHIEEYDITCDITGGTKGVSAGMVLACVRSKRRVQYLRQNDYQLQQIDVNVHSIPHLFDEMMEQIELIRAKHDI